MSLFLYGCIIEVNNDDGIFDNCTEGVGPIVSQEFNLPALVGVEVRGAANVTVEQGPEQLIIVTGHENIINLVQTSVRAGVWEFELDRCVESSDLLDVKIILPTIEYLGISGAGTIFGSNQIVTDGIELAISGSGEIDLLLDAIDVFASITGSGILKLEGIADYFDMEITGSGDLKAFALQSARCLVDIKGSGNAEVNVIDALNVKIRGSGDVYYVGNPALSVTVSGSGEVINAN